MIDVTRGSNADGPTGRAIAIGKRTYFAFTQRSLEVLPSQKITRLDTSRVLFPGPILEFPRFGCALKPPAPSTMPGPLTPDPRWVEQLRPGRGNKQGHAILVDEIDHLNAWVIDNPPRINMLWFCMRRLS